jgi:hypothetical protein
MSNAENEYPTPTDDAVTHMSPTGVSALLKRVEEIEREHPDWFGSRRVPGE